MEIDYQTFLLTCAFWCFAFVGVLMWIVHVTLNPQRGQ